MAESTVTAVFRADISDMSGKMDKLARGLNKVDDHARKAGSGFAMFKGVIGGAAVAGATYALFNFAKGALDAATEAQKAVAKLDQVSKSMGLMDTALGGSTARLQEFASTLSQTTGVEDEVIMGAQALLMTFKGVAVSAGEANGMFDRATRAAADLAAVGFGSISSNAKQLGRALEDPIRGMDALRRSGVTLSASEKEQVKAFMARGEVAKAQEVIMSAVEKQSAGTAAAMATDAEKMKLAFSELQETIGVALFPVIQGLAKSLTPVIKNLEGPLGAVAEAFGTVLKDAFDAIAPILPDLSVAIAVIGKTLGGVLAGAIKAILPILQPMLVLFAQIAEKVGPLLGPLLEKLGVIFGKLVQAVMPLLEPLIELVFTILDAAMPIITTLADVLGILIDALAPLFPVVAQILKPLGQLINVLFKALMPILKPLLPVIEALAAVFADVLTRAIGLIITALGGMILQGSKVAPFLLTYLVKPLVEGFLTMADNIVKTAATAFSWVPGLGDKLKTAQTAINTFKGQATTAVSEAARAIEAEGTKIGKGLIDQGILAMTDPTRATALATESRKIGKAMAQGMERGLLAHKPQVVQAASDVAGAAISATKLRLAISSPSKVFMDIGRDVGEGYRLGIEYEQAALVGSVMNIGQNVISAFVKGMASKDSEAREQARKTMRASITDAYQEVVDRLRGDIDSIKGEMQSFGQSVSQAIVSGLNFGAAFSQMGAEGGMSFMDALRLQAENARLFAERVKTLVQMGLSQDALTQVLQAGTEAGTAIALQLIQGGQKAIDETNALVLSSQQAADEVALLASNAYYGAGLSTARDTLNGFMSVFGPGGSGRAAILGAMDSLAASMNRSATITVTTVHRTVYESVGSRLPGRAMGGPVSANEAYVVGERGPEVFVPGMSGNVIPNNALGSVKGGVSVGGAATFNITVNAGMGTNGAQVGREIVEAIKRFERTNGPVFAAA